MKTPKDAKYLKFTRMDKKEYVIIPITNDKLLENGDVSERYGWSGLSGSAYKANHLGIYDKSSKVPRKQVSIRYTPDVDKLGWGFGHKTFVDDRQYYSWGGEEIKKTDFEIAVTASSLTFAEKKQLLE